MAGGFRTLDQRGVGAPPIEVERPDINLSQSQGTGITTFAERFGPVVAAQRPTAETPRPQPRPGPAPDPAAVPTSDESAPQERRGLFEAWGEGIRQVLPAAAYQVARNSPVGNQLDLVLRQARSTQNGAGNAGALAAADRSTVGLLDTLARGQAQVETLRTGGTFGEAEEQGQIAADVVNQNLEMSRTEHPIASFVGDVTGTIISGGPIMNAATAIPGIGRSVFLTAAIAGGTEEALYTLNSDGTLEEAAYRGGTAAVLSGVGAKLFQGIGGLGRLVFGRSDREFQERVGTEIYRAMQGQHLSTTGQELSPDDAMRMLAQLDPEEVVSDAFPDLLPQVRALAGTSDPQARQTILGILRNRNDMTFNYRNSVLEAVRGNNMRSLAAFDDYLNQQQRALRPRYDDLFDRMDAAQYAREVPTMRDSITRLFDTTASNHGDDLGAVMRVFDDVSRNRGRMTFREINDARKQIQTLIYDRIRHNANSPSSEALPIGNLQQANHYLRGLLAQNDEFVQLQATYGDIEDARNAYTFAMNTIRRPNMLGEDAQLFYGGQNSNLVAEALVEGGRFGLYTQVRGAANPTNALREARLEDLGSIIGTDAVEQISQQAVRAANMEATRATVDAASRARPSDPTQAFRGQTIMDLFTASQAVGGNARGVGPAFAGRRLIQRAFGSDVAPYPGEVQRAARVGAEAFTDNNQAIAALRAMSQQGAPGLMQMLGMAGGVQTTDTAANSDFVQETLPQTAGQLNDFLTNALYNATQ